MSAMEIGLFQLENLLQTPALFVYVDLRLDPAQTPERAKPLLHKSVALLAEQLEGYLLDNKIPQSAPLLLLCENGKSSHQVATRLFSKGHDQIYVVSGGLEGLLNDL
jgi:rhodanese-related sulfurtransferase